MEFHFGFADINHKFKDDLVLMMTEYEIEKYIIALEKVDGKKTHIETQGEHIHFVIYTDPKNFKRFKETLKNKYMLSGKNGKTKRYAGWMNKEKVRDKDKFMSYTMKDGNVIWKGFTEEEIKQLKEDSFQKTDTLIEELMKHLLANRFELRKMPKEQTLTSHNDPRFQGKFDIQALEIEIMKFHMMKEKRICKSQVKNLTLTYLQLHMIDRLNEIETIYFYMVNI